MRASEASQVRSNSITGARKGLVRVAGQWAALIVIVLCSAGAGAPTVDRSAREEAHRFNNLGVGLLEQYAYAPAADAFRQALAKDPQLVLARVNLAIALLSVPDMAGAAAEAQGAIEVAPNLPQAQYVLGLAARAENRLPEALAAFDRVLSIDPGDVGARINVGQIHLQERRYPEAVAAFRSASQAEPFNATAIYNLAMALTRSGQRDEAAQKMAQFQELRTSGHAKTLGQVYLEQGRYAEAMVARGLEPELIEPVIPDWHLRLEAVKAGALVPGATPGGQADSDGGITLLDFDGDGDLDLFVVGTKGQTLLRNDGGVFADVTATAGLTGSPADGAGRGAVAADFDNDGSVDLFVLRSKVSRLYRNEKGRFSDVTQAAGLPQRSLDALAAAFGDVDHDGDVDLILPPAESGAENALRLFRNNGNGTFTDVGAASRIVSPLKVRAVVATDFDNRRDTDVLLLDEAAGPRLFASLRDGTFHEVASEVGLAATGRFTTLAAGDINKDGFTDFFLARSDAAALFALSDGRGRFTLTPAPPETAGTTAALLVDLDNDGLLDLVGVAEGSLYGLRNAATAWATIARERVGAVNARSLVAADLDGDGDTDLLMRTATGELILARNDGGQRNHSQTLRITGRVSNRGGVGTKVELRSGSLVQRTEVYASTPAAAPADLVLGLGSRATVDVVRLLWPSGILQAESELGGQTTKAFMVTELDRKPSSCPFLYAWNGKRFEFITDFLGAGEMGYWEEPGVWSHPDPDEYVRIRSDQLRERDGRLELRVTNELEEVLYLDRAELLAITHPRGVEVYPNEGMVAAPGRPFHVFGARDARLPVRAVDDHGHDVREVLARLDHRFPDDFELQRIRGFAAEHTLTLDLGPARAGGTLLLMTGWTDYAFSSDNVAGHQAGLRLAPPVLEVRGADGRWRDSGVDVGVPVGRPQTIVLDLTDALAGDSREVRVRTNMRIYWDRIQVATRDDRAATAPLRLEARTADLRWRGFSAELLTGREPLDYDYARVSLVSPWKTFAGRYTREGDVRELLTAADDRFVISRPGDEIGLSFDASALPPLAPGLERTYLLYADGFSKEMDINSASPDAVTPLPFHKMTRYPYVAPEAYPTTEAHREYLERYNTRVVAAPLPRLEAALAASRRGASAAPSD